MEDSHDPIPFNQSYWFETLNGEAGLLAIAVGLIFVFIIVTVFIVRIFQFSHLRQQVINDYITVDNTRSVPTRILQMFIFLFLTAGLVGVVYFNVSTMINDPPKISVTLVENDMAPSMLFCTGRGSLSRNFSNYYHNFNDFSQVYNTKINGDGKSVDLAHAFSDFAEGAYGNCLFFNGTKFPKPQDKNGGFYELGFISDATNIIVFIGDSSTHMNWTLNIPQGKNGNMFSDIGVHVLNKNGGLLGYAETRLTVLDGKRMYRSFQSSVIENFDFNETDSGEILIEVDIVAPRIITNQVEKPSLTLAEFFSNVGGYLGIWGIFGFLFGGGKVDPFGFVSRFVFMKQDKTKLLKELEKMKGDKNVKPRILEEEKNKVDIEIKTSDLSDQTEFKNLLARYYVETRNRLLRTCR